MFPKLKFPYVLAFILGALCSAPVVWLGIHAATFQHAPPLPFTIIPGTAIKEAQLNANTFAYYIPYDNAEMHQQPAAPLLDRLATRTMEANKDTFAMLSFDASQLCQPQRGHDSLGNIIIMRPLSDHPDEIVHLPRADQSSLSDNTPKRRQANPASFHDL
jgi:hypothetical protein